MGCWHLMASRALIILPEGFLSDRHQQKHLAPFSPQSLSQGCIRHADNTKRTVHCSRSPPTVPSIHSASAIDRTFIRNVRILQALSKTDAPLKVTAFPPPAGKRGQLDSLSIQAGLFIRRLPECGGCESRAKVAAKSVERNMLLLNRVCHASCAR